MKKRFLSLLLVFTMLCSLCSITAFAAENDNGYTDVNASDWYYEGIQYVSEKGLMSGIENQQFDPHGTTSRGMIVAILWRLEGKPDAPAAQFVDVAADQYYADAVAWASEKKIVEGYGNGVFGPNDPITREQMAAIFYRYAALKSFDVTTKGDVSAYQDADQISSYAVVPMLWAIENGLISGTGGSMLEPQANAPRSQAAAILMRFDKNVILPAAEQEITFTVSFDANGGSGAVSSVRVKKGEKVTAPAAPTRSGYTFDGWYTAKSGGTKYDFNTAVTANLSLYARWTEMKSSGGGGGGSSKKAVTAVDIQCGGASAAGKELHQGDVLSYATTPAGATGTVSWKVGGIEKSIAATYTVGALDVGQTITVTVTGTGSYTGTVTSAATGKVAAVSVDLSNTNVNAAPVVVDAGATFKDETGDEVTIAAGDTVSMSVSSQEAASSEELNTSLAGELGVTAANITDASVKYVQVDAQLSLKKDGAETEQEIHPVGDTTVTLSKENLGIDGDVDISNYTFVAKHTNKNDVEETVTGTVVEINGVQYVRFELNGLSVIWIGNIPPLTVTFDTAGGTAIPPQKVKFAWYVKDPEAPTKAGYLFTGWDYDLATFQVLRDTTITAQWIEGTKVDVDKLTHGWTSAVSFDDLEEAVRPKISAANGTVTVELNSEAVYPENLAYQLTVAPVEGAAKWAVASTGTAAAAATEYSTNSSELTITKPVTDDAGKVITQNPSTTLYIKWVDAEEKVLGVQSATLTIKTEKPALSFDTPTETNTVSVNRGFGRITSYLTNTKTPSSLEDYVSYANAYLQSRWNDSSHQDEYDLDVSNSFDRSFHKRDDETERDMEIDAEDYDTLKVVITPFEGETIPADLTATAEIRKNDAWVKHTTTVSREKDGSVIITCPRPAFDENSSNIHLYLRLNSTGKSQSVRFYLRRPTAGPDFKEAKTWDEVLAFLNAYANAHIEYVGSSDVTLSQNLTLKPGQEVFMSADLIVDNGAVLTLQGDGHDGAHLDAQNIIVKNGTITTNSQAAGQGNYYMAGIYAQNQFEIQEKGKIVVPERGFLGASAATNENPDNKLIIRQGAKVQVNGHLDFDSPVRLGGTINAEGNGNLYFYGGMDIEKTGSVVWSGTSVGYVDGKVVNNGTILVNTGIEDDDVTFAGSFENNGMIRVDKGRVGFHHTGYSVTNNGTISVVKGTEIYVTGTVLVNTGRITGDGKLTLDIAHDTSDYDNGIEYVEVEDKWTPSRYSRYQFVRDPAATVEEITFFAKLDNQNGGTCTCTVQQP